MKIKKTLLAIVVLFAVFFVIHRSNGRLSVWCNHGIWLPDSAMAINNLEYPAFIVLTDDWAKTTLLMKHSDFQVFLSEQRYCVNASCIGKHIAFPDSLLNKYPVQADCKSPDGDFLAIRGEKLGGDTVRVCLYMDWN